MRMKSRFWGTVVLSMAVFFVCAGPARAAEVNTLPFAGTHQPLIIEAYGSVQVNGSTVDLEGALVTVETADINNDGVPDIIAGGETLFVYDVKNSSYIWAIDESSGQLADEIDDIAVADITGDGTLDVVTIDYYDPDGASGVGSDGLCLWDGTDGSLIWSRDVQSDNRDRTYHVEVLEIQDLDGDGDLDIAVGGYLGTIEGNAYDAEAIAAFQASDGAYLWHFTTPADSGLSAVSYINCVEMGDIDGDGLPEVAAGDDSYQIYCVNGEDGTEVFTVEVPDLYYVEDIELADFDQDGDLDIATGSEEYVLAYDESGDEIWRFDDFETESYIWSDLHIADFNQDGVPDVAAVNYQYGWAIVNGADGTAINSGGVFGNGSVAAVGDLDGNGTPELVYGDDNSTCPVDAATGGWQWLHDNGYNTVYDLELADFNGDGRNAVIGVAGRENFVFVLGGKTPYNYSAIGGVPVDFDWVDPSTKFMDVVSADADLDGDADLIVGDTGLSRIFAADGTSGSKIWEYPCSNGDPQILATGDFDGDGNTEIAAFGDSWLYMLDTDGTELVSTSTGNNHHQFLVADINNDGSDDLVIGAYRGTVQAWSYPYPGNKIFETGDLDFNSASSSSQNETGLAYGDVDGDGEAELLALGYDTVTSRYHVYEIDVSDGSAVSIADYTTPWNIIALAQLDDDAQMEILLSYSDAIDSGGIDAIDQSEVDPSSFEYEWQSTAYPSDNGLLAADLDGDGYDEAISGGRNNIYGIDHEGTVLWSEDFTGTTENYNNDESDVLKDMVLADLDGDGNLDVAAAFRSGVNLHMLDAETGEALIDAIVLDGYGEAGIQLATGDFSPQAGTEVAVSTEVTTGVFGTVMQTGAGSTGSGSASSSSSGGGGCFISTIR